MVRRAERAYRDISPRVRWHGKGGAQLSDMNALLSVLAASGPPPGLIIIHLGTNDLVTLDAFCLRQGIRLFMSECLARFPAATVVWSDILPRACYFGAWSPSKIEKKRRLINKWSRSFGRRLGVGVLHHPQFKWSFFHLFRFDGVHLSAEGVSLFQQNFLECIQFFYH